MDQSLTDSPGASAPNYGASSRLFADRYDLVRCLKEGNGVHTHLALDRRTGERVVLKTIEQSTVSGTAQSRFVHETSLLRQLSAAGRARLHDAGRTDTHLYLAQRFVTGRSLELVLQDGPLPVITVLRIAIDVVRSLEIAHEVEVLHRDVKPANVIVDDARDGRDDTATLIDFGFARSPQLDDAIADQLVGTVRYLAPESAGLLPSPPDQRSDLYAVGIVIFECLAGHAPFTGPTVGDLLRQHLSSTAPDLRSHSQAVPRALAEAVTRLLRTDPAERYQSAAALLSDLRQILAAIEAGDADPAVVIGRADRRATLTDPVFVGRDGELARLAALAHRLQLGSGALVLLEADSGGGKSRLLAEVREHCAELHITTVRGQGVALAGQRPLTLLHGVADGLVRILSADEPRRRAAAEALADDTSTIVRALPALASVLGESTGLIAGPDVFGEDRSLSALRRLLTVVATEDHPLLIVLDDCQWADPLTLRLLRELFGADEPAPRNLAVIAAFRSEEVPGGHPLRSITAAQSMRLGQLSPRSIRLLAESMAGPLPEDALDTIVRLAEGSPFMAAAVLRGLVEAGALAATDAGWQIEAAKFAAAQAASRAAAFLVLRLELLTPEALALLSVAAVLGKHFEIVTAERVAGRERGAAEILDDARRRRLIWVDETGTTGTFFHDKVRESLLDRLDPEVRRELHSQAADVLVAASGPDPDDDRVFDLAYHLSAAGRSRDALPYALVAARLARERYALDAAVEHLRSAADAAEVSDETDPATRLEIADALGDVLMLQGAYPEARAQFESARRQVTAPLRVADIDSKLGSLAFKYGDIPTAKQYLEGALRPLGRRMPRSWALVPCLLWELLIQIVHTIAPRVTTGRRRAQGHEDDFLAMRIHSRLAYLYWFHSGKVACAWTHLRGMNLAERYPPSAELAQAWSEHAPAMTMIPWYARGIRYAERSLAIRRELGDVWGQGQSLNFLGAAKYAASQYAQAQQLCEDAGTTLRRTGDEWEINTAGWNLALCHLRQGNLDTALEMAREMHHTGGVIGDETAAGVSLSIWSRATLGHVPLELVREQLSKGSADAQVTAELHLAEALVHRVAGDPVRAVECIERAVELVRAAGLRQEYAAPLFVYHAMLLRELAESTSGHRPRLRRTRLRAAGRAARSARRWAFCYRNNIPHALRESALVASLRGRHRKAVALLVRSVEVAVAHGARRDEALSRLALAEITATRAGADLATDADVLAARGVVQDGSPVEADAACGEDGRPATLSRFDRLSGLLTAGRAIAAATSRASLEAIIRQSALSLLRAERCHLAPASGLTGDRVTTQSGEELDGISRSLLLRAVEEGKPVVSAGAASREVDESLVLSGVRAAMAAPIFVQGEVVSCLYVTHRQLGEFFGEDEMQVAAFIAALAGATYEHLAGNETRFRALVQRSSDVITLIDPDGIVSYQSSAVAELFGMPVGGLVGQCVTTWIHHDDLERFRTVLATAPFAAETTVDCRFMHTDGRFRETENTITNLLDEPTVGALVINTRDVTDRKLAERQLREKNLELEKVSRAKDSFLASMSHELRTPLNAIIGFTGTLLMQLPGPLNTDQERQLRTVERSGKHLLSIINDLLDMAKIESGEVRLVLEDVDCAEIVRSATSSLQPLADDKGLSLSIRLPATAVVARADARALGQIMINLVNNAIKFTATGGVDVALVADHVTGKHRITVTDTGPGIAEEELGRIFDAFERGREGGPRTQEGTGLGLHISRKLGELIGARVGVMTQVGVGSAFTVDFAGGLSGAARGIEGAP